MTLLIPVFATIEWLSLTDSTVRLWSSIGAAMFVILISFYIAASRQTEKYITFLQIAISLIETIFLTLPHMMSNFETVHSADPGLYPSYTVPSDSEDQTLSWEDYYKFCRQPAWDQLGNQIQTQLRCARLDGTVVRWEGNVGSLEMLLKMIFVQK